ncbi:MAG: PIN domain-containing protein [Pseudomonadota bacterium]
MNTAFLDTSIVLRHILGERGARAGLEKFDKLYASEILRVEALRALDRLRISGRWPEEEVALRVRLLTATGAAISWVPIQPAILRRASEPFPTVVGTLDAIHIATALLLREQIKKQFIFLTYDLRQGIAAEAAGLEASGFSR